MSGQRETGSTQLKPPVEKVRSHYDKSNEFFKLWLDPSMTYSCGYFDENPDPQNLTKTLEEAQYAKRKLALDKLNLEPGMTLLDIGSGWGSTMRHAVAEYDVNVIGLTLSENQYAHCVAEFDKMDSTRHKEVRIQGWEEFPGDVPIDRIVSLGAFEHFADGAGDAGYERYATFFKKYYDLLPDDGRMLLHSIVVPTAEEGKAMGLQVNMTLLRFISFILKEIYPGGKLPQVNLRDLHRQAGGRHPARDRQGARRPLAGHPRRAQPQALHGLLRQLQRCADAVAGRHGRRDQPRRRPARPGPRAGVGDPRFPHGPQSCADRRAVCTGARRGRRRAGRNRVPSARRPLKAPLISSRHHGHR